MFEPIVESYISAATALFGSGDELMACRMLDAAIKESERFDSTNVQVARVIRRVAKIHAQMKALSLFNRALLIFQINRRAYAVETSLVLMDLAELALTLSRPRGAKLYLERARKALDTVPFEGIDQSPRKRLIELSSSTNTKQHSAGGQVSNRF
ncbi:MAG: tetratricopeptide repeat protein [Candidatus Obscuribacterales bacterium]|nr:tetratricopeptide repeat protein [Candidatus Obscuribacterales bacterium]